MTPISPWPVRVPLEPIPNGVWSRWLSSLVVAVNYLLTGILSGEGSPEGVVTAAIGTLYRRTDGGASTSFYVKESGTSTTGWVAK